MSDLVKYFKTITPPKLILWCYLVWYLSIIGLYFEKSPVLWASSLGIALIIGFALRLSTNQPGIKQDLWVKIRLFLFPFCVSSYSATIKGHNFILLFPSNLLHLSVAVLCCLLFLVVVRWIKIF